jgi:hypothetical protein
MNLEDYNPNNPYNQQKHELLLKLGFHLLPNSDHRYVHPLLFGLFDFSASSIEGIVKFIYDQAFNDGKSMKIVEIKRVLEIE